jgi:outer membrane protein OmpA-like peptidoglycan-associated protein
MKRLFIIIIVSIISGCVSYPEEGKGGWAEEYHPDSPIVSDIDSTMIYQIKNEYTHLSMKIDWLKSRGIRKCMPAQLYQAKIMLNRINREIAAEMYNEAKEDLRIFYHQTNKLENHFEKIIEKTECISNSIEQDEKINTRIEYLLNSDNQFAINDSKITPKYKDKITQASELLKINNTTKIILVGHADNIGEERSNYELAYKRAENVKKWLILYGVKEDQLTTSTQGSSSPYSNEKESKTKKHSDRRVNAYVILKNSKEEKENKIKPLTEWTNKLNKKDK